MVSLAQNLPAGQTVTPSISPGQTVTPASGNTFTLTNPIAFRSICGLIKALFNAILQIGTPIAVLFLAYAGFKFILARGNEKALTDAKSNLMNVIIGIAIFLGAWILGQIIATTVNTIATQSGQSGTSSGACN